MKKQITLFDKLLIWFFHLLQEYRGNMQILLAGFLIGRLTNELSVVNVGFNDVLRAMFSFDDRPTNLLTWIAVVSLFIIPLMNRIFTRAYSKRRYDLIFASLLRPHRSQAIAPFDSLGWNDSLSLQISPNIRRGWTLANIQFHHETSSFSIPVKYQNQYEEYKKEYWQSKRFFDDGTKIMLSKNPTAFVDSPTLVLETKETCYSVVQFYQDYLAQLPTQRDRLIQDAVNGSINFPHSLCMHIVVETSDAKLLMTRRSEKVAYFPGTWSLSIEEQIDAKDLEGVNHVALSWGKRALLEELGLDNNSYSAANFRILSVFLESNVLNISLCAHVTLDISSTDLDLILHGVPRKDYEYTEWDFLDVNNLVHQLFVPTRSYHPTTGYRMLMSLIHHQGEFKTAEELMRLS